MFLHGMQHLPHEGQCRYNNNAAVPVCVRVRGALPISTNYVTSAALPRRFASCSSTAQSSDISPTQL